MWGFIMLGTCWNWSYYDPWGYDSRRGNQSLVGSVGGTWILCVCLSYMRYYDVLQCIMYTYIYIHTYIRKCDVPPELIWCFPKVLTLWLPHRLQPPQHQVLMSLSSLDQEDDEDCRKWVVRGVAKMLQKVGEETMTGQQHSDNLSG